MSLPLLRSRWLQAFLPFALAAASLAASTVRPPTFELLVQRADCVVRADTLHVRAEARGTGTRRHIVTIVTLAVRETIVGVAPRRLELEFLGGSVPGRSLVVTDQPQFQAGDSDVLFIAGNGRQICPLVNMSYGRYPVVRDPLDASRELVVRDDGTPLRAPADVARPLFESTRTTPSPRTGAPLSLGDFAAQIRSTAAAVRRDR